MICMIFIKILKNITQIKKGKILFVFDDMIADILSNNSIVTELFIRGRRLNIPFVFITQSHFAVSKNIRLNSTHYFIMKIQNKQEPKQAACNHSSDIDLRNFMRKIYYETIFFFSC